MTGEQYDDALFTLVRKRLRRREIRDWLVAGSAALGMLVLATTTALLMVRVVDRQAAEPSVCPVATSGVSG